MRNVCRFPFFTRKVESSLISNLVSALLIIVFPTAFWMGVLEFTNHLSALELGVTALLDSGGALVALLSVVWRITVNID